MGAEGLGLKIICSFDFVRQHVLSLVRCKLY